MNKTSKELTPLEALNIIIHQFSIDDFPLLEYTRIIKKALKQAQKDKEMLDIFKNALTIEYHDYPMVEQHNDSEDVMSYLVKELYTIRQSELDKDMRKALREWVLENAFPKELKALETIKELFIFQPDKFYPFVWKELSDPPKEKIDLLKEVLL